MMGDDGSVLSPREGRLIPNPPGLGEIQVLNGTGLDIGAHRVHDDLIGAVTGVKFRDGVDLQVLVNVDRTADVPEKGPAAGAVVDGELSKNRVGPFWEAAEVEVPNGIRVSVRLIERESLLCQCCEVVLEPLNHLMKSNGSIHNSAPFSAGFSSWRRWGTGESAPMIPKGQRKALPVNSITNLLVFPVRIERFPNSEAFLIARAAFLRA